MGAQAMNQGAIHGTRKIACQSAGIRGSSAMNPRLRRIPEYFLKVVPMASIASWTSA